MKTTTRFFCSALCGVLLCATMLPKRAELVTAVTFPMTAPSVKEEKIVATMRSNSEAASAKWHTADFAAVRLNVTTGTGADDGDWNRYTSLYMGLSEDGQGADLSEIKSFSLEAKATEVGNSDTELNWRAIDSDGTVIGYLPEKLRVVNYNEGNGAQSYNANGVHLNHQIPTTVKGERGLGDYQQPTEYAYTVLGKDTTDGKHVPNADEIFNWTRVTAFIVEVSIDKRKTIDVGSLYGTDVYGEEKVLFDMGEASKANSLNEFFAISKNEYYVGPTPKYIATPETGKTASELEQYVENSYRAHNTKKDTLEVIKQAGASDASIKLFPESVADNVYNAESRGTIDVSEYDGVAFTVDASEATRFETRINFSLQKDNVNYVARGTESKPALIIEENGNWELANSELEVHDFRAGFQGTVVIPFSSFTVDAQGATSLPIGALGEIDGIRAQPITAMFNENEAVRLTDIKLVNYANDLVKLGADSALPQTTTSAVDKSNGVPDGIRFKFSILESGYTYLEENYQNNFSLGVLVLPEPLLGEEELTIDTAQVLVIHADLWYEQTGVARYFTGVLIGIPESCKKVKCVARAYVRIGENYFYGEPIKYSYQDCYIVDGETDDDLPYDPEWDNPTHGSNDDPGQVDVFTNQVVLGRLDGWLGKQLNGNF